MFITAFFGGTERQTIWVKDQEVSYPVSRKAPPENDGFDELEDIGPVRQEYLNLAHKRTLQEWMDEGFHSRSAEANSNTRVDELNGIAKRLKEQKEQRECWKAYVDHVYANCVHFESSFRQLKQNMDVLSPGSPVRIRNNAKLNSMTKGRFQTLHNLEFEYENYLFDKGIYRMRRGYLSQHLAKFVCESVISEELVEVEVREFLERVFSGGE